MTVLAGFGQFAVASTLGGEIDDDGAWGHGLDHFLGNENRRAFAGNGGGW